MGGENHRIESCALCGRVGSDSTIVVAVARWSIFECEMRSRFSTAASGDSEAVARNERLADELPSSVCAMDIQNIRPRFNFSQSLTHEFGETLQFGD